MKIKRMLALIAAIAILLMYILTAVFEIVNTPFANIFFGFTVACTFMLFPLLFIIKRVPRDMVQIWDTVNEALEEETKKEAEQEK